jgi:hypothetical protein
MRCRGARRTLRRRLSRPPATAAARRWAATRPGPWRGRPQRARTPSVSSSTSARAAAKDDEPEKKNKKGRCGGVALPPQPT